MGILFIAVLSLTLTAGIVIMFWQIGTFVYNQCNAYNPNAHNGNSAVAQQEGITNYSVENLWNWHIGTTYFNYACSFKEEGQFITIN